MITNQELITKIDKNQEHVNKLQELLDKQYKMIKDLFKIINKT